MSVAGIIKRPLFSRSGQGKIRWFNRFDLFLLGCVGALLLIAFLTNTQGKPQSPHTSSSSNGGYGGMSITQQQQRQTLDPPCKPNAKGECVIDETQPKPTSGTPTCQDANCPPPNVSSAPNDVTSTAPGPNLNTNSDDNTKRLSQTYASDTTANASVQKVWWAMVALADALLALIITINGIRIMMGAAGFRYADAIETIPRILLALIGVHISLVFIAFWIGLNNGICSVIYNIIQNVPTPKYQLTSVDDFFGLLFGSILRDLGNHLAGWIKWILNYQDVPVQDANSIIANGIAGLMIWFLSIFLYIQLIVRIGLINLLIIISPLGMISWALPQGAGQQFFRFWLNAMVATVMVQCLQFLCYAGAAAIFGNLTGKVFGLDIVNLVLVAALWLALRVPGWLQNAVVGSMSNASQSAAAAINQAAMAAQQLVGTAILAAR